MNWIRNESVTELDTDTSVYTTTILLSNPTNYNVQLLTSHCTTVTLHHT